MFDAYAGNISSTYLPEFRDLMQRSAAQAAAATSRPMETDSFDGNAVIQSSPTGRYGVVFYSFRWSGFAKTGNELSIGDALAGGLYLAKDTTLIVRYPEGYTVSVSEPAPDQVRDGLIWYGLRSFGAGEPHLVFDKSGYSLVSGCCGIRYCPFCHRGCWCEYYQGDVHLNLMNLKKRQQDYLKLTL